MAFATVSSISWNDTPWYTHEL